MGWSTETRRVYGRNGRQWWGLILKMSPEGEQPLQLWATGTIIINNSNILSAIGKKFYMCPTEKKQTFVDFPIVNLFHFFMQRNSWLSFLTRLTQLCFVKCCWARCSSTSTCCAHVQTPTRSVHAYSSLSCSPSQSQVQYACAETCSLPWVATLLWSQWKLLEQRRWWSHWLQSWCPVLYTVVLAALKFSCLHAVLQMYICPGSLCYILQKWVSISCPEDNLWLGWHGQGGAHSFETTMPSWASLPCCHIPARMELSRTGRWTGSGQQEEHAPVHREEQSSLTNTLRCECFAPVSWGAQPCTWGCCCTAFPCM